MTPPLKRMSRSIRSLGVQALAFGGFKMETIGWKRAKDLLLRSGLRATNCVPEVNSIMPYALSPTPEDPVQQVEALLPNLERMANLNPETIVMIRGRAAIAR